jgi:DNA-binding response OmpR family regulator
VPDAPPRRLLIVDDDDDLANAFTRVLERAGWAVHRARTGTEALALAAGMTALDAAMVDLVLPGVGGIEIVRALRRTHPACLIVAVTGLAAPSVGKAFRDAGADHFFAKPVDVSALLDALGSQPS